MSQVVRPDISDSRYKELVLFIIQEIQVEPAGEGGVYHKSLTDSYLRRYLDPNRSDNEAYVRSERHLIVKLLRYLVEEQILAIVKRPTGGQGFIIGPNHDSAKETTSTMKPPIVDHDQSDAETLSIRRQGDTEKAQAECDTGTYTGVCNRDESLSAQATIATSKQTLPITPSKRRTMPDEITDSNSSSPFAASTPERALKRRASPEELSRRAAPSEYGTPNKANTPRPRRYQDEVLHKAPLLIKNERKISDWMVSALGRLRQTYPQSRIDAVPQGEFFECLDCEKSCASWHGSSRTTKYFETHLQSKSHMDSQTSSEDAVILSNKTSKSTVYQTECSFMRQLSIPDIQSYNVPNITADAEVPKSDSTQHALQAAKAHILHFLTIIENDSMTQAERTRILEAQVNAAEARNHESVKEAKEAVTAAEKKAQRLIEDMDTRLATSEAHSKVQAARVEQQFSETGWKMQGQIDGLRGQLTRSESEANERAEGLEERFTAFERNSSDNHESLSRRVALTDERKREQLGDISSRFEALEQEKNAQFKQLMERVRTLEQANETQHEECLNLESMLQLHTEALKRYEDNEAELRESIAAQLKAHHEQSAEEISKLDRDTCERISGIATANTLKQQALLAETTQRIKALQRENLQILQATEKSNEEKLIAVKREVSEEASRLEQRYTDKIRFMETSNKELAARIAQYDSLLQKVFRGVEQLPDMIEQHVKSAVSQNRKATLPHAARRRSRLQTSRTFSRRSSR
ncbi:hypothetical protein B0O99DRAFT_86759 [Bisporella sp. PMI_857]|nr:hypothetical protein B0O99DRAFT_86759 [Bisporella sp. PMI_857]